MIKSSDPKAVILSLVASLALGQGPRSASADIELPFIHEDAYGNTYLQSNRLVATHDFTIDYDDDCTYVTYSRERESENLLAKLIN